MSATDNAQHKITMTAWELEKEREHAVIKSKLDGIENLVPELFQNIKQLTKSVTEIPVEIINCRNEVDKEMKQYMHDEFVTAADLQKAETKIEARIGVEMKKMGIDITSLKQMIWRATWIVSGFITAGVTIFWILSHTNITIS